MINTYYGSSGEPLSLEFQRDLADRDDGGDSQKIHFQEDRRWALDGDGTVSTLPLPPLIPRLNRTYL